jgi:hypothetical protein
MADETDNRELPTQPPSPSANNRQVDIDLSQSIGEQDAGSRAVGMNVEHFTAQEVHVHNPPVLPSSVATSPTPPLSLRSITTKAVVGLVAAVLVNIGTSRLPEG